MSEQTIQDGLYSIPVQLDKYTCRSLGATTIKDLVKNKEITGLTAKECKDIKANKPDVLVLNKNKEIVIFIEMKTPDEFHSDALKRLAKYQELLVAKQTKAKIYVISDGDTFIWFNPLTEEHIPLYSGNTEGSFDMVDSFDYDGEYLTWAKDGLAGYMMLHNGKFSLTGHRGILIPTDNCQNIDLTYIKYVLEPIFRANKKGREGDLGKNEYTTLNSDMIKKMKDTIPIPILDNGSYDIEKQKELAIKYEKLENIKLELMNKIIELTNIVIA